MALSRYSIPARFVTWTDRSRSSSGWGAKPNAEPHGLSTRIRRDRYPERSSQSSVVAAPSCSASSAAPPASPGESPASGTQDPASGTASGGCPTSGVAASVPSPTGGSAGRSGAGSGASPRTYLPGPTWTQGTGTGAAGDIGFDRLRARTRLVSTGGDPEGSTGSGFCPREPDASTLSSDPPGGGSPPTSGLVHGRGTLSEFKGGGWSFVRRNLSWVSRCHATSAR